MRQTCVVLVVLAFGFPAAAAAQSDGAPDPAKVRVRIGPLWMNPSIGLTNLGVDDNVFNEAEDQQPKSDFTATFTPRTDLWVRMGRSWLRGTIDEQLVWYQKHSTARSTNTRPSSAGGCPPTSSTSTLAPATRTRLTPGYDDAGRRPTSACGGNRRQGGVEELRRRGFSGRRSISTISDVRQSAPGRVEPRHHHGGADAASS